MANDRERDEEQEEAPRPVTAASRRGRRAGAAGNGTTPRAKSDSQATNGKPASGAKPSGKKPSGGSDGKATQSKATAAGKATTPKKGRPTRQRDRTEKQPSVVAKVALFLREVVNELRKVIWPTRKQMVTYFIVVMVFLIVLVGFVFGLDLGFSKLMFLIFG